MLVYNYDMNQESRMLLTVVVAALVIGAVLGGGGYYLGSRTAQNAVSMTVPDQTPDITPVSTTSSVIVGTIASSSSVGSSSLSDSLSGPSDGSSDSQNIAPPANGVNTNDWKTYTNYELGFSFQYPPDLTVDTSNPSVVTMDFPATYFSTSMTDSDSFSVTVSATCTPEQSFSDKSGILPAQTTTINNVAFSEYTQESVGAGTYYNGLIYQGNNNNVCYTIEYTSNGSNSVEPYNAAQDTAMLTSHANDAANIEAIVNSMLSTFTFVSTPAGENEAVYSAQQSQQQNQIEQQSTTSASINGGIINLTAVSPNPVSVGASLILTGSGFSGNANAGVNNTTVWISNGSVQGALWSGVSSSDTSIIATIPAQACTQNFAGTSCPSYLILNPGIYTVSVSNQNGTTDPVYVRIQ